MRVIVISPLLPLVLSACVQGQVPGDGRDAFEATGLVDLEREGGPVVVLRPDGARISDSSGELDARLPQRGSDGFVLGGDDGVTVVELGLDGDLTQRSKSSASYARRDGKSIFSSDGNGSVEEWLDVVPSASGRIEIAWEVDGGGAVLADDGSVIVTSAAGADRFVVTAPIANGASGAVYTPTLDVVDGFLVVSVEHAGAEERVLVDPVWRQAGNLALARAFAPTAVLPNGKVMAANGEVGFNYASDSTEIYEPTGGFWHFGPSTPDRRRGHVVAVLSNGKVLWGGGLVEDGQVHAPLPQPESFTCFVLDVETGAFTPVAPMPYPAIQASAVNLLDGRLLVIGGTSQVWDGDPNTVPTNTIVDVAQIYDPSADAWQVVTMPIPRIVPGFARMVDGRVLIAGGETTNYVGTSEAEIFSPATDTFSVIASIPTLLYARNTALTPLATGKVFAVVVDNTVSPAEERGYLYDPVANAWAPAGMANTYHAGTQVLVPNGRVELLGGELTYPPGTETPLVDEYDPATNLWSQQPSMPAGTAASRTGDVVEPNGRVVRAAGFLPSVNLYSKKTPVLDVDRASLTMANGMVHPRAGHTATLMKSGRMLFVGGMTTGSALTNLVDIFTPGTGLGTWAATAPLGTARKLHTATLLSSGDVLAVGGMGNAGALASVERFNGTSWTGLSPMPVATWSHTATLLDDGRIYVAGGCSGSLAVVKSNAARIYDPSTSSWSAAPTLKTPRCGHTATLLPSKRVLLVGGDGLATTTAEIFDPAVGVNTFTTPMSGNHDTGHTATLMTSDTVWVYGGKTGGGVTGRADAYNETSGSWSLGQNLVPRSGHTTTLLPSGRLMSVGGQPASSPSDEWDPEWFTTLNAAPQNAALRSGGTATIAFDGRVVIAGGMNGSTVLGSVEIYDEGRNQAAPLVATLNVIGGAGPGGVIGAFGAGFMGAMGSTGAGTVWQGTVETSFPLLALTRVDDGQTFYATTKSFTPTAMTARIPSAARRGPYLARVVVAGTVSSARALNVN